jgi:peptidoglycan/xylan/chitin deacetylase (PgdA/CDA1 family)
VLSGTRVRPRWASRARHVLKVLAAEALYRTGMLRLLQAVLLRGRAVVLMYHRVLTPEERARSGSHPGIIVDADTFAVHMALLKSRFTVLSWEQFAGHVNRRIPFPSSSCLITFDDGWSDNYTNAFPVLTRENLPAVVFLPVSYIGERRLFWQEALTHLLRRTRTDTERRPELAHSLREFLTRHGAAATLDVPTEDLDDTVASIVTDLKQTSQTSPYSFVEELASVLGVDVGQLAPVDTFIDWRQAQVMADAGIAFGGHGVTHRLLTHLPDDEAEREARVSREAVLDRLAQSEPGFSYPNGSWSPPAAEAVQRAGYQLAFTTAPGPVRCTDEPYALRRVNIHEDATGRPSLFLARVLGLF